MHVKLAQQYHKLTQVCEQNNRRIIHSLQIYWSFSIHYYWVGRKVRVVFATTQKKHFNCTVVKGHFKNNIMARILSSGANVLSFI